MRFTPCIAWPPASSYFKVTSKVFRVFFPFFSMDFTNPASLSFSAIAYLNAECGTEILPFLMAPAFLRRITKSPTGSFVIIKYLPGGFLYPRNIAFQRLLAETDAAKAEIAHESARTSALKTAPYGAAREFRLSL